MRRKTMEERGSEQQTRPGTDRWHVWTWSWADGMLIIAACCCWSRRNTTAAVVYRATHSLSVARTARKSIGHQSKAHVSSFMWLITWPRSTSSYPWILSRNAPTSSYSTSDEAALWDTAVVCMYIACILWPSISLSCSLPPSAQSAPRPTPNSTILILFRFI
nr:hypothetical protein CFP56_71894 [Quercus suber]